ncbi:MAG: putative sulfate exporter family transporter [Pirellulales bacterium]
MAEDSAPTPDPAWWQREDWLAVLLGAALLAASLVATLSARPTGEAKKITSPLAAWVAKPKPWADNPFEAFFSQPPAAADALPLAFTLGVAVAAFGVAAAAQGTSPRAFLPAFAALFALALLAEILAGQKVVRYYGLEYPLWALLIGLAISNTVGTPAWLRPALRTELYIKVGLVLLGAEVLLGRLMALGAPGMLVSWVTTPIVLVSTYIFGQKVLRLESKALNMTLSADMSVCGVSAAIATGAACRAKREELSLAIGISLAFTVVMMIAMPPVIRALELGPVLGGAWIGGTIDSTGAVAVAGELLGDPAALTVAVTIKMIQNILIGVVAFGVAVYWTGWVEPAETGVKPSLWEVWRRFPRFVLGFLAASAVFSWLHASPAFGSAVATASTDPTKVLREWFFCLGFVSIGLESRAKDFLPYLRDGKPVALYVVGQTLNLALTLAMAYLAFNVLFPEAALELTK